MNLREIQGKMARLAAEDNGKKIAQRRKRMAELAMAAEEMAAFLKMQSAQLRRRHGLFFTVNQGRVLGGSSLSAEMCGHGIGVIRFEEGHAVFHPKGEMGPWNWSGNQKDGQAIRDFLEQKAKKYDTRNTQERELQWDLFHGMRRKKEAAFRGCTPIALAGHPAEIPTWIKGNGDLGTGNIDLLVRTQGGNRGSRFLVFELKRPKEGCNAEDALRQAAFYASALAIEANGDERYRTVYRKLFGSRGSARLDFGAVAVVDKNGNSDDSIREALRTLQAEGCGALSEVRVLRYEWVDNSATHWRWFSGT